MRLSYGSVLLPLFVWCCATHVALHAAHSTARLMCRSWLLPVLSGVLLSVHIRTAARWRHNRWHIMTWGVLAAPLLLLYACAATCSMAALQLPAPVARVCMARCACCSWTAHHAAQPVGAAVLHCCGALEGCCGHAAPAAAAASPAAAQGAASGVVPGCPMHCVATDGTAKGVGRRWRSSPVQRLVVGAPSC
jgi:hypothetical protein